MALRSTVFLAGIFALVAGCKTAHQVRDPEFAYTSYAVQQASHFAEPAVADTNPAFSDFEGPRPLEEYIRFALAENPDIQAARNRVEAFAHQVPVAGSLPDPMLSLTVQPQPVQTAAGPQNLILSANQKIYWAGKLGTRSSVAAAQTNVARQQLAAIELATIEKVKRAYYELYYIQQAIAVTEADQNLLADIRDVANTQYKAGKTSQQDVLRAELEISVVENELIQLRQRLESSQARLARLLHIAPQTRVLALDHLPTDQLPDDLDWLHSQAVAKRPQLHAQLAAIERDRQSVELARLEYRPDVTLGFSWIDVANGGLSPVANGRDAFLLTTGFNLPVYRRRLDSSLRSAEAKVASSAREYDSLRDGTLEEVTDLFAQARSQQDMLTLFREDILPKTRQTLQVSSRAYNVGEVDFLQLLDNWRQLLRYEVSYRRLEASVRQTMAELERVVGGFDAPPADAITAEPLPLPPE